MRPRPSSASILSAGLIAAAFGLLLLVVLALLSAPERADGGVLSTATRPLRSADDGASNLLEPPPAPPRAPRADAGDAKVGLRRQLVAGGQRELPEPDDFALPEPSMRSAAPLRPEPPFMADLADELEGPNPDPPSIPDAGSVGQQALEAAPAAAQPAPDARPTEPPAAERAGAVGGENEAIERETCGPRLCPAGWVCCNESCGTCTEPGQRCSQLSCSMPAFPVSVPCGRNTCAIGEVCCNRSCGICAAPGEACSQRVCD